MNIIVFGANGGIGQHVVSQALEAGHHVTAAVRRPEAITLRHENLYIVRADVLDPASLPPLIAGSDVVVSSIGVQDRKPTTLYSSGIGNVMSAMQMERVRRLFCVSANGLEPGPLLQRLIARPLLWAMFKEMYTDLTRMETLVKASDVQWTIMRPPRLTDGTRTGKYKIAVNQSLSGGWQISRADVADYIVRNITNPEAYCAVVELAY